MATILRLADRFLLWFFLRGFTGRVSVGTVREAMRRTGLGLFKGGFFSEKGKACCPLAQLVRVVKPGERFASSGIVLHQFPHLNDSYVNGFMMGYDHGIYIPENTEMWGSPRTRKYLQGHRDGAKVRHQLVEA